MHASWCNAAEGSAGRATHTLPRSAAQRAVAQLRLGATPRTPLRRTRDHRASAKASRLRLEGDASARARARRLASRRTTSAARSAPPSRTPREGWLGSDELPVHLTLNPAPDRLSSIPGAVPPRAAAIAPQPGAPVGRARQQALAVGDKARSRATCPARAGSRKACFGAGGRVADAAPARGRLADARRAPTRSATRRSATQMWLWRGETGLWEPDPATPLNFRGNLLGHRVRPERTRAAATPSASRACCCATARPGPRNPKRLPPEVAGRELHLDRVRGLGGDRRLPHAASPGNGEAPHYTGGLLVNDGSGWQVDQAAAAALGSRGALGGRRRCPTAARRCRRRRRHRGERADPRAQRGRRAVAADAARTPAAKRRARWRCSAKAAPLRAIGSGGVPRHALDVEDAPPPPPGFPPTLIGPYPLGRRGDVAAPDGERLERRGARTQHARRTRSGDYKSLRQGLPARPDRGRADRPDRRAGMGGRRVVDNESGGVLDTADVARYPADGVPPPGVGSAHRSPVERRARRRSRSAATRSAGAVRRPRRTRHRPRRVAVARRSGRRRQIAGVRAFLYTGPRVTTAKPSGHATLRCPTRASSRATRAAARPEPAPGLRRRLADRPRRRRASECAFRDVFGGFPRRSAAGRPEPRLAGRSCAARRAASPPTTPSTPRAPAGPVRVIVLDDSRATSTRPSSRGSPASCMPPQQAGEPAIVVGNADLNAQIAAGDGAAAEVAQTLRQPGAPSAYFYDSPEQNVKRPLRGRRRVDPDLRLGHARLRQTQRQSERQTSSARAASCSPRSTVRRSARGEQPSRR